MAYGTALGAAASLLFAGKNMRKDCKRKGETTAIVFIFVIAILALLVYLVMSKYKLPF